MSNTMLVDEPAVLISFGSGGDDIWVFWESTTDCNTPDLEGASVGDIVVAS